MTGLLAFRFHLEQGRRADVSGHIPARAISTLRQHEVNATRLLRAANPEGHLSAADQVRHLVTWFSSQHSVWAARTIYAYRAALFCMIEHAEDAGLLSAIDADQLVSKLTQDIAPRSSRAARRTSARKAKSISVEEHRALIEHLIRRKDETSRLLGAMLYFGVELGLRPSEYYDAVTDGDLLSIRCAKHTNGRGVAEFRDIDVSAWPLDKKRSLAGFLKRLSVATAAHGSRKRMHQRLAKALERACLAIGIRKIALYSLRHQTIATAKLSKMPIEQIAAIAGHKSTKTTTSAYAKARGGWRLKITVCATSQIIALVNVVPEFTPSSTVARCP